MNSSSESSLLVGRIDGTLWVRVESRGSFKNSPDLRAVAESGMRRGMQRIVVDLAACPIMDSTFMGTLTSLHLALEKLPDGGGNLIVLNANDRNLDLLQSLGLDNVFHVDKDGTELPELRREVDEEILARAIVQPLDKTEHAAHVLEAHEALAGANEANRDRFRDVVSFLRSEVQGDSAKS
ncbi:MAG: STAS domain-containing protein [Verrucomicrobiales bacterium]